MDCPTRAGARKMAQRLSLLTALAAAVSSACAESPDELWAEAQTALVSYEDLRALPLLKAATASGHARAQEALGLILVIGRETFGPAFPRDRDEGLEWLSRSAAQGSAVAPSSCARKRPA